MRGRCDGSESVSQTVSKTPSVAKIMRETTFAVSGKFAQLGCDRSMNGPVFRTQNPLPAMACGFDSHLRQCRIHGVGERGAFDALPPNGASVRKAVIDPSEK